MNKIIAIAVVACCAAVPSLMAADKKMNKDGNDVFAKYDANKNGVLDAEEITALRADFKKGDAALKAYDTNSDGILDDNEVAAIKPPEKGKKKKK